MHHTTTHNPDRYMADLRQILSQGRKRIGFLLGAGVPAAVKVNAEGKLDDAGGPVLPDVAGLTREVLGALDAEDKEIIDILSLELGDNPTIELILTCVRRLSEAIGGAKVHGLNGSDYKELAERICEKIGNKVDCSLPQGQSPYTRLVSWISGTSRSHPVEIFTPNYDLLFEEAFERAQVPYYDGFTGARRPFFDPASIVVDKLSPRWSRLWKIHGSLGWDVEDDKIVRTGGRNATKLIYPDHHKYNQITRQPYSAFFDRLRIFLMTPDSLLICAGFSFSDAHITAVLDEALAANPHTAIIAFEFQPLTEGAPSAKLALSRPNMNVYARDNAVICGTLGRWRLGEPPNIAWKVIRKTFWASEPDSEDGGFLLGDFAWLANFLALARVDELMPQARLPESNSGASDDGDSSESEAKPADQQGNA